MSTSEAILHELRLLFDGSVKGGAEYRLVYGYHMRQRNYIVYRSTIVTNYAIGYKPGTRQLVAVPVSGDPGRLVAGEPAFIDENNYAGKRRSLQGSTVLKTTDGGKMAFIVLPKVTKLMTIVYQLPVNQEQEYAYFDQFIKALP
jgi:hypothetical protein